MRPAASVWWLVVLMACTGGDASNGEGARGGADMTGGLGGVGGSGGTGGAGGGDSGGTGGVSSAGVGGLGGEGGGGLGGEGGGGMGGGAGGGGGGALLDRLSASVVTVPAGVKGGGRNWRIWDSVALRVAPVFTAPLANCGTLIGYTSGSSQSPNARAIRLGPDDTLVGMHDLGAGLEVRGIAAEPDGHFAALLWDNENDQIWVKRYDVSGMEQFSTELVNDDNTPDSFGLGEGRLEFGGGRYGAYYHVHSDSGHEGDTLKYVSADSGAEETEWSWGCSHSMSNLLTYSAAVDEFLPTCVTDCYPGTEGSSFETTSIGGVYVNNRRKVLDVAAGCNGTVAGELGGAAVASDGWKLVFNGHVGPVELGQASYDPDTMNQDIAFASIGSDRMPSGEVVWLTETAGVNEADSALARWQPEGDDAEQYLVGWFEPPARYQLARLDPEGAILEGPIDISEKARWGERDDPFRAHMNHDVVWAWFADEGSTELNVARLRSDGTAECASF